MLEKLRHLGKIRKYLIASNWPKSSGVGEIFFCYMESVVTEDTEEITRALHPKVALKTISLGIWVQSEKQFNLKSFLPNDLSYHFPPFIMLFKILYCPRALSFLFVRNCKLLHTKMYLSFVITINNNGKVDNLSNFRKVKDV